MNRTLLLLAVLMGAVVVLKALATSRPRYGTPGIQPRRFMTPREAAMLAILERCLPQYRFHAQVSMGALLDAAPNPLRRRTPADRNAFSQKIVDFVAQDRATGTVVALIEVDDATHNAARDRKRDEMTGRAGYRTLRIGRSVPPRMDAVRDVIAPLLLQPAGERRG